MRTVYTCDSTGSLLSIDELPVFKDMNIGADMEHKEVEKFIFILPNTHFLLCQ